MTDVASQTLSHRTGSKSLENIDQKLAGVIAVNSHPEGKLYNTASVITGLWHNYELSVCTFCQVVFTFHGVTQRKACVLDT